MLKRVTIVGSGSWATALVKLFSESAVNVSWLVRNSDQAEYINKNGHNPRYLSFAVLEKRYVKATAEAAKAFSGSDLVLFALPSSYLKDTKTAWKLSP